MIGAALRKIREAEGWTLTETAKALNLSKSHVSEIENGKKTPSLETLQSYAKLFDLPLSTIMFFSEQLDTDEGSVSKKARAFLGRKLLELL